jgi:hypothetical protein
MSPASCAPLVTVLVTPLPSPQEIDSVDGAASVCMHVANVHVGRSNRLTRFQEQPLLRQGFVNWRELPRQVAEPPHLTSVLMSSR